MIEVQNLTKYYGKSLVVDDLSFTIQPGKVTGFLGPNGAGKSTTMQMMTCLNRPTSGRALIAGKRYNECTAPMRTVGAALGLPVHKGRSIKNHLLSLARSNGISLRRVNEVLEVVGLGSAAKKRGKALSQGMHQRLDIAAALLGDPEVLLFDEPLNGLDPEGVVWIRTLMKDLAGEGRTVFVSSHVMSEMSMTADHLVLIGQGRLLADCSFDAFIDENSQSYILVRSSEDEKLRDVLATQSVAVENDVNALRVSGTTAEVVGELAMENRVALRELTTVQSSLEDVFMQLTSERVEYRSDRKAEENG